MQAAKKAFGSEGSAQKEGFCEHRIPEADPLSITKITLTNFRNYGSLRLSLNSAPVVLAGANGSGKTNLLESISLLVPGRGLRHSPLADLQNRATDKPWAVAIELDTDAGSLRIGTGRDNAVNDSEGERRLVHIDGKPARGQALLAERIAMAWMTPDMDRLLADSSSVRRKFLDSLVCGFDPSHGSRVRVYEKAMRERMCLLREGRNDALWLSALENEMAQAAVAIAAARRHMIDRLRRVIEDASDAFPRADVSVHGTAEDMLDNAPALPVEDALRAAFARARGEDASRGTTAIGAHKSDLCVMYYDKNCPADLCSAGEQKMLMIALMLAHVRLLTEARRMAPLFLLDDCAAHLDDYHRNCLFEEILSTGAQAWFTGTDRETFALLKPFAQIFDVKNGSVS
ncbi:MAG: DNA replication/repair protein RecF [Bdellovibrionales bacterium]